MFRAARCAVVLSCVAAAILPATSASAEVLVISRFGAGDDGWRVVGDATSPVPTHVTTGGNPGGYIRTFDDRLGGSIYWEAPAKFLGDQSSAYAGALTFDLRQGGVGVRVERNDVILKGAGLTLTHDTANNPGAEWTHYRVPLRARQWSNGAQQATKAELRAALGSVESLRIRAEYTNGDDVDDLDNPALRG